MNLAHLSQKLFRSTSKEDASLFFISIIFLGLVTDRGILSIGMISMIVYIFFRSQWPLAFKNLFYRKELLAITLIFFVYALSGFYSENLPLLSERLRIKLPFLLLPLVFAQLKPYSKKQFTTILYLYLGIISLAGLGVLINYFIFFQEITESFKYGKSIPTPYSHIRFSLFVVFGFFVGLELLRSRITLKFPWERKLVLVLTVFLFFLPHVLAVRSGLLALYLASIFWVISYFIRKRQLTVGILLTMLIISLPFIAYKVIPTFNKKIDYMIYDLKMMSSGTKQEYSDTQRLLSIKVGWELIKENVWWGVGSGDVRPVVIDYYKQHYPEIKTDHNRKSPHNQFVTTWLANGIFGLFAFTIFLLYPLFINRNYKFLLMSCFYIIILSSLMTENTLEVQLGVGFYLAVVLPLLNYLYKNDQTIGSDHSI
ncbi:MAG: O-antigen ligase family protein [Chitinophagales bacterium]|nr:O-antigen ligase family protein [Chitinophagales bacterium]